MQSVLNENDVKFLLSIVKWPDDVEIIRNDDVVFVNVYPKLCGIQIPLRCILTSLDSRRPKMCNSWKELVLLEDAISTAFKFFKNEIQNFSFKFFTNSGKPFYKLYFASF